MHFKHSAIVLTADGQDAGRIDRVVLDPQTKEVTHLVVRQGFLFVEDKVIPVSLVENATEDGISLRADARKLEAMPRFEETHYVRLDEAEWRQAPDRYGAGYALPLYWYPPMASGMDSPGIVGPPRTSYVARTDRNIPEDTVALKVGAKVIAADGHHVGNVEDVLMEPEADRATSIVISHGLLLKGKKRIPASWISAVAEEEVHLAVGSRLLERLRAHPG